MIGKMQGSFCKSEQCQSPRIVANPLFVYIRFLYTLYLAVDANFKLKGKDRGIEDIELEPGWGAFVNENHYQQHISNFVQQPEVRSVSIVLYALSNNTFRLIHVIQSMMPSFVRPFAVPLGIQSTEQVLLSALVTA